MSSLFCFCCFSPFFLLALLCGVSIIITMYMYSNRVLLVPVLLAANPILPSAIKYEYKCMKYIFRAFTTSCSTSRNSHSDPRSHVLTPFSCIMFWSIAANVLDMGTAMGWHRTQRGAIKIYSWEDLVWQRRQRNSCLAWKSTIRYDVLGVAINYYIFLFKMLTFMWRILTFSHLTIFIILADNDNMIIIPCWITENLR